MDMKTVYSVMSLSFLIIFLLVTPVNGSSDWVEYYRSTNGNVFSYRVKHRTQDTVEVWDKYVFSDESKKKIFKKMIKEGWSSTTYVNISHSLSLVEIDCNTERSRILSITFYNTDGQSVFPNSSIKTDWDYIIILNSPYDTLRKEVCK